MLDLDIQRYLPQCIVDHGISTRNLIYPCIHKMEINAEIHNKTFFHFINGGWNLGTLEPWNHGTMEPWSLGTLEPWNHGTMEPWSLGTLEPWNHGTMEPWNLGALKPWNLGTLKPWNLGTLEPWNLGTLEPWHLGTMEPWNHGTLEPLFSPFKDQLEPWKETRDKSRERREATFYNCIKFLNNFNVFRLKTICPRTLRSIIKHTTMSSPPWNPFLRKLFFLILQTFFQTWSNIGIKSFYVYVKKDIGIIFLMIDVQIVKLGFTFC